MMVARELGRRPVLRLQQDGELIAAQPRHAFGGADDGEQALADLAQHVIADAVSERVVHVFEAVEVHHQDGHTPPRGGGEADGLLEPLGELGAIGEVGERVLVRELQYALLAVLDARRACD